MRIKDVVDATGLSRDTIRFYEKEGLIDAPTRRPNQYREYDRRCVDHLKMIIKAKALGFTLKEIKDLVASLKGEGLSRKDMKDQLTQKQQMIQHKIAELQHIQQEIEKALSGLCEFQEELT